MTWTHNICKTCWQKRNPHRDPHWLLARPEQHCCFCGAINYDGIYIRENPVNVELVCGGSHIEEESRR